jgi:hypothetical protein
VLLNLSEAVRCSACDSVGDKLILCLLFDIIVIT